MLTGLCPSLAACICAPTVCSTLGTGDAEVRLCDLQQVSLLGETQVTVNTCLPSGECLEGAVGRVLEGGNSLFTLRAAVG